MAVAFIPVRGGSKSIPLKNIKPLSGMPLVYWSIKALHDSESVDKIIVATDSDEIESAVSSFNLPGVFIYRRSAENATDTATTESVMLEYLNSHPLDDSEIFILVQATSPLTQSSHIREAIQKYKEEDLDSLLTGVRSKRFYWNDDGSPINYDPANRPRRQDFDGVIVENGAFYISRVKNILESRNRLSGKIGIYEMPEYTHVEIDEPDDWKMVEHAMSKINSTTKNLSDIKLFLSDMDGTLTDAGMYYSEKGDELKRFSTYDGKAFELLRNNRILTGIITSENTKIAERRSKKIRADFLYQGVSGKDKLKIAHKLCDDLSISIKQVAYIGDDVNCIDLLSSVGVAACPFNARSEVKKVPGIIELRTNGGSGAVREFADLILSSL